MLAPISDFDDPDDALRDAAAQQLVLIAEHAELASRALSIRDDPSGRYHLRKAVAHVRPRARPCRRPRGEQGEAGGPTMPGDQFSADLARLDYLAPPAEDEPDAHEPAGEDDPTPKQRDADPRPQSPAQLVVDLPLIDVGAWEGQPVPPREWAF